MDPKALDHLHPNQKEQYDRIMGHATSTDPNAPTQTPPPPIDAMPQAPGISHDFSGAPTDTFSQPQENLGLSPIQTPQPEVTAGGVDLSGPQFYTPGQETAAPDLSAPSAFSDNTQNPYGETTSQPFETSLGTSSPQDNLAPPNSSFFSNPSAEVPNATGQPAELSEPYQSAVEDAPQEPLSSFPASTPVTPYTPSAIPGLAPASDQFTAPLPSPASVNQELPKEASPLVRVLYIVGATIFFAIYSIFWIKVFNLPFLF